LNPIFYNAADSTYGYGTDTATSLTVTSNRSGTLSKPQWGPSSSHPAIVNHLFVDGSVRSINEDVDVTIYMFLITRDGGDLSNPFFGK
jgi:hypothetical protein